MKKEWIIGVLCMVTMPFFIGGCDDSNSNNNAEEKSVSTTENMDIEAQKINDMDDNFFNRKPLETNPYAEYRDSKDDVRYVAYYINQYIGPYFNEERDSVFHAIAEHPEKIPVKFDEKNRWVMTNSSSPYYYCGEMNDNKPNGKGVIYGVTYNDISTPQVVEFGNFKDGVLDGSYGIKILSPENKKQQQIAGIIAGLSANGGYYEFKRSNDIKSSQDAVYSVIIPRDNNSAATHFIGQPGVYSNSGERIIPTIYIGRGGSKLKKGKEFAIGRKKDFPTLIYYGEFIADKMMLYENGLGTAYYLVGAYTKRYEGEWNHGTENGKGISYYPDGRIKYQGEFLRGKYNGKGILYKEDGSIKYEGQWKNGDYDIK